MSGAVALREQDRLACNRVRCFFKKTSNECFNNDFFFFNFYFERGFLVRPKNCGFKMKFVVEMRAVSLAMCVSASLSTLSPSLVALEHVNAQIWLG